MPMKNHAPSVLWFASLFSLPSLAKDAAPLDIWYQEPFRIQAEGVVLDTAASAQDDPSDDMTRLRNAVGHAGPALADVDGDGKRDLVVGTFSGRFRFHRNVGTDAAPEFSGQYTWLQGGDHPAEVPIYCCVASSPVITDLDGDGIVDLVSGSYDPGAIYWFKGRGQGRFGERHTLTDTVGVPIVAHIESLKTNIQASLCSIPALADLNGDGLPDLVAGNFDGELFIRINKGTERRVPGYTPLPSQPVFEDRPAEIKIDRGNAVKEWHSAPNAADWDGDGLTDLLVGTYTGAVYWLRNTGKLGEPKFETRQPLLGTGVGSNQWEVSGAAPRRGIRAQVQAADYNKDGNLDLLVGDWTNTIAPRPNLTSAEKKKLKALEQELAALDKEVGYDQAMPLYLDKTYGQNQLMLRKASDLHREIGKYLVEYGSGDRKTTVRHHGYVWVYLRRAPGE